MMRAYEMMIIIDGDVDDPKAQSWMKTVTDGVGAAGGELHGKIDWWGKRQFAYPINKKPSGYYMVAEIVAPAARSTNSSARSVSRTMWSVTSSSVCPKPRPSAAAWQCPPPERSGQAKGNNMASENSVTLVGNLTKDPELRYTTGGRGVASFGLAVNRRYQVNGEWQEQVPFFNIVAWGDLGRTPPPASTRATASSSPVGWSSAPTRPKKARSATSPK